MGRTAPSSTACQRPGLDGDLRLAAGVDLVDRRGEHDVDVLGRADLEVGVERARVAVEVLACAELHRVDEDRDDEGVAAASRDRASVISEA